jgi:hypothetical protein
MKKTLLFSLAALAAVASSATLASTTSDNNPNPRAGVKVNETGAFVSPYFAREAGVVTVTKAGPAESTSCKSPYDNTLVLVTYKDTAGSFGIRRPADVTGNVRYCVTRVNVNSLDLNVVYDRVGP